MKMNAASLQDKAGWLAQAGSPQQEDEVAYHP